MLIRLKMPFFILYHILFYLSSVLYITLGKNAGILVRPRSTRKMPYGTRSGDTEFSDHFREILRPYEELEVAKKSHIGVLVAGNGHWTAVHSPLDMSIYM
jgi:hypothetical protein